MNRQTLGKTSFDQAIHYFKLVWSHFAKEHEFELNHRQLLGHRQWFSPTTGNSTWFFYFTDIFNPVQSFWFRMSFAANQKFTIFKSF